MRLTYSPGADALTIRLAEDAHSEGTRELAPGIFGDFDKRDRLIQIEVLGASRLYDRQSLEQLAQPITWLTLAQAAAEAKLSRSTLKNQILNERLPARKQGRDWLVAQHELWNYLENRAPQGRPGKAPRGTRQRKPKALATA